MRHVFHDDEGRCGKLFLQRSEDAGQEVGSQRRDDAEANRSDHRVGAGLGDFFDAGDGIEDDPRLFEDQFACRRDA
jgi:hypothetical protein